MAEGTAAGVDADDGAAAAWAAFAATPPLPQADDLTAFYWAGANEHRLLILRCNACGSYIHEPRAWCRFCLSTDLAPAEVSGRGRLDTFTIPMQPSHPYFMARVPYNLAIVELVEQPGLKLVSSVVDCEEQDLRVGMPLRVVFRAVADDVTLPYFTPE
ncbi:MAG: Zn-ribbon domain-containing OB-fold protein [Acidimicrobiia bacterium]